MTQPSLKEKTARGLFWGGISNGALQVLNLVFGIFLSRLLTPADYGMVGMLTLFSALANIFVEGGFIAAIVNKKEARHEDYNAVFWFNILGGTTIYLLLFLSAPLIADFYHTPALVPLSRFLFIAFFLSSCGTAPSAYFLRNLLVKERAKIQITSIVVSGIVGVICAFNGMGYWGIAIQTVLYTGLNTLLLWILSPWKPTLSIRLRPLLEMLPFSSKLFFTYIFNQLNLNLLSVLLGRYYTKQEVGFYTQGNKWTSMGYATIAGMINSVAQPVLRESATDQQRLKNVFRKMLRFTAFTSFPLMLGLALIANELIVISVTSKWAASSDVMQILCIWGAFLPIATLYSNVMNSIGRPNIYMWNTIGLGIAQLLCILFSYPYGLKVMLIAYVTINIIWLFVWQYFAWKHLSLRLTEMLKDILPYLAASVLVIATTYFATSFISNIYLLLIAKIALAAALYTLIMWKFNSVIFAECVQYFLKKKKK